MINFYDNSQWILAIIGVCTVLIYVFYLYDKNRRFGMLLNKIPGPKPVFLFGNILPFIRVSNEDWFRELYNISKGFMKEPIFRLWFGSSPNIFVNQAPAVEVVLNSNRLIDKGSGYLLVHPWLGLGLLTSTGDKWKSRRKLITPSFHFRILDEFFKVFVKQTDVLIQILDNLKDKDCVNIYPYLTRCTLDIICETAMGKRINAQSDTDSEYVKAIYNVAQIITLRSLLPWLQYNWIFSLTHYGRTHRKSLKVLHGFTKKVIEERWAEFLANPDANTSGQVSENVEDYIGKKRRLAFLDLLLENFRDSQTLNVEDIREEVDTFMFEGHDTTASGIAWTLYNVGRYPEIQKRLHQEIDELFETSGKLQSKDDLSQLKYLELVIKESIRLFPPVPLYSRQTKEEIDLCGYKVPAGVEVTISAYMIHRDEKYFPDPERFDPDRFLPENSTNRHPFSYVPFSAGPRNCIGQKFAMMELKTTICQILRKFTVTSLHKVDDIKLLADFVLRPYNGVWFKLENRHNS